MTVSWVVRGAEWCVVVVACLLGAHHALLQQQLVDAPEDLHGEAVACAQLRCTVLGVPH